MTVVVIVGIILLFWLSYLVYEIISKEIRWQRAKAIIEEEKAAIERVKENEKKFYEVMAGLGFQNPLADFLRLTKENRVLWKEIPADHLGVLFRAENIVDGISLDLDTGMEITTIPGPIAVYHELTFFDRQERFLATHFVSISGDKEVAREPEEKLVEEYSEWLMKKFGKPA
jgi:hypothetical protein